MRANIGSKTIKKELEMPTTIFYRDAVDSGPATLPDLDNQAIL